MNEESAGVTIFKKEFTKKLKLYDDINDFKISINNRDNYDNCGDNSMVIIGVNPKTLDIDLYAYDYDIDLIKFILGHLEQKFPDYKFVIKKFYSVL